jgi:N4-gp56 family major capsid protein
MITRGDGSTTPVPGGGTGSTNPELFVNAWILRKFVETLDLNAVLAKVPRTDTLPTSQGADVVRWVQFPRLAADTTVLVEGTDPVGPTAVPSTQVEGVIQQYGAYIQTSDIFPLTAITGSIAAMVERLSRQAVDTVDTLIRDKAKAGDNVFANDGLGQAAAAGDILKPVSLRNVSEFFQNNNVDPHPATMGGKFYFTVVHPTASWQLQAQADWQEAVKYVTTGSSAVLALDGSSTGGASNIWHGSPGIYAGHQIALSTNIDEGTNVVTVKNNLSFGKEGMGHVALNSNIMKPEIIIRKPGPNTLSSPLGMRMTWGWKINYVTEIIDQKQVAVMQTALV